MAFGVSNCEQPFPISWYRANNQRNIGNKQQTRLYPHFRAIIWDNALKHLAYSQIPILLSMQKTHTHTLNLLIVFQNNCHLLLVKWWIFSFHLANYPGFSTPAGDDFYGLDLPSSWWEPDFSRLGNETYETMLVKEFLHVYVYAYIYIYLNVYVLRVSNYHWIGQILTTGTMTGILRS